MWDPTTRYELDTDVWGIREEKRVEDVSVLGDPYICTWSFSNLNVGITEHKVINSRTS